MTVEPRDLPLLLASDYFAPHQEPEPIDRIRLQKGVFLLQMAGPEAWRGFYTFAPYDWGPFSRGLAVDVNDLLREDLLKVEQVSGRNHGRYRTAPEGGERVKKLRSMMNNTERDFVRRVRAYVTSRSFAQLLREVYRAYPEYATRSRFSG